MIGARADPKASFLRTSLVPEGDVLAAKRGKQSMSYPVMVPMNHNSDHPGKISVKTQ